jgi:DNA invertase Pin-like site-specific DNA recombinase
MILVPAGMAGQRAHRHAVRQSTLQQLEHHRESTRVRYGLADRTCRLGWPRPRVTVIDDDLGCSGATVEGRPGFQRLVAEVGLVLGFRCPA